MSPGLGLVSEHKDIGYLSPGGEIYRSWHTTPKISVSEVTRPSDALLIHEEHFGMNKHCKDNSFKEFENSDIDNADYDNERSSRTSSSRSSDSSDDAISVRAVARQSTKSRTMPTSHSADLLSVSDSSRRGYSSFEQRQPLPRHTSTVQRSSTRRQSRAPPLSKTQSERLPSSRTQSTDDSTKWRSSSCRSRIQVSLVDSDEEEDDRLAEESISQLREEFLLERTQMRGRRCAVTCKEIKKCLKDNNFSPRRSRREKRDSADLVDEEIENIFFYSIRGRRNSVCYSYYE